MFYERKGKMDINISHIASNRDNLKRTKFFRDVHDDFSIVVEMVREPARV